MEIVPTTNIVLNWADAKTEAHELDRDLSTIKVQSKDGFAFNLDVSQIIHVPRDRASAVIARFGNMRNLVTQVLEPTIGNYFRNSAQSSDAIDFLMGRKERQEAAAAQIRDAISGHDVEAVDTLIGDINPPAALMKTLTQQKIAERQVATFNAQKTAAEAQQELSRAQAEAQTRGQVVAASRAVEVADFNARAVIKTAEGEAGAKKANADADAYVQETVGAATAKRTLAVGDAEAQVQELKVKSIGQEGYARIQIVAALAEAGIALVPDILVSGDGGTGQGSGIINALLGNMLRDDLRDKSRSATPPASE